MSNGHSGDWEGTGSLDVEITRSCYLDVGLSHVREMKRDFAVGA